MLKFCTLLIFSICVSFNLLFSQVLNEDGSIVDPNDPSEYFGEGYFYNENNLPDRPQSGYIGKWIRAKALNWNTDQYKAYIYRDLPFRLMFPKNYDPNRSEKYPIIIHTHGNGRKGGWYVYDNDKVLGNGGREHMDAVNQGKFDGFLLFPQHAGGWPARETDKIVDIVNFLAEFHNVDINRVNAFGTSGGATGLWEFLIRNPKFFASVLPASGVMTNSEVTNNRDKFKFTPMWYFQGGKDINPDPNYATVVVNQILSVGGNIRYTTYENRGHGVWPATYNEEDYFPFQIRAHKANPWPLFEQTEFCPNVSIDVTLGLTPGFSGYEWRKDGVLIAGATGHTYRVREAGVFDARIKRGNEWSVWSPAPVTVNVKDPTITPPIQLASDASRAIPNPSGTSTVLELPEGFVSYQWKKVGSTTILGTERRLEVTQPGEYIASVTEKFGCSSNFSAPFSVIASSGSQGPDPISGLVGSAISKTELQLNWSDNPNAQYNETGFEVYRSQNEGGTYQLIHITNPDELSFRDTGLQAGTTYYYTVRPVNANAAGAVSSEISVKTKDDTNAPTAPLNLSVSATTSSSISLVWDEATDDVGIDKYEVYRNGTKALVTSESTITAFGLSAGQVYTFYVKAVDQSGNESPASNQVSAVAVDDGLAYSYYEGRWSNLPNFDNLTPKATGQVDNFTLAPRQRNNEFAFKFEGKINIPTSGTYTFYTRSDDGSKLYINGQQVVSNDGVHGSRERNGTITLNEGAHDIVVTYFDQSSGERLEVRWKGPGISKDKIPNSALKGDVTLPGEPPVSASNLVATTVSYDQINLSWEDNSDDESKFEVYQATSASGPYTIIASVGENKTSYQSKELTPSTTYYYRIVAVGQYGSSDPEPAILPVGDKTPDGYWNFDNNTTDQSNNNLEVDLLNGATYTATAKTGTHAIALDGNDDLIDLQSNYFNDAFQERSVAFWFTTTDAGSEQVLYDEGGATNGLAIRIINNSLEAAVRNNKSQKTISVPFSSTEWSHVAVVFDNGTLTMYLNGEAVASNNNVGYTTVGSHGDDAGLGGTNGGSNAFNDNGSPLHGSIDEFYVFSSAIPANQADVLAGGTSAEGASFATTDPLLPAPVAPSNLLATPLSGTAIELTWDDNSDNEDSFEVYRSVSNNSDFLLLTTLPNSDDASISYTDSDLFTNVTYYYKVAALNDGGKSESNESFASTLNSAPVIDDIQDLSATIDETTEVQLSSVDADGDQLTFSTQSLPSFASIEDNGDGTGRILMNPTSEDAGTYSDVTILVEDEFGGGDQTSFTIVVNNNQPPVIQTIDNITLQEGTSTTLEVSISDSDNNNITLSLADNPAFVSLTDNSDGTGIINITPGLNDSGNYPMQLVANDDQGGTTTESFTISVVEKKTNSVVSINFHKAGENIAGTPWNNISSTNQSSSLIDLVDEENAATSIDMTLLDSWSGSNGLGESSGIYPNSVVRSYFFEKNNDQRQIKFSDLDSDFKYTFVFFASRSGTGARTTNYIINNEVVTLNPDGNNNETVQIEGVRPDQNGEVLLTLERAVSSTHAYISAIVIEGAFDDGTSPEAPTNLQVELGQSEIVLNWEDNSGIENGYEIFRAQQVEGSTLMYEKIATVSSDITTYNDADVTGDLAYYYKVRAFNDNGPSDFSQEVTVSVPNTAPVIEPIAPIALVFNETVNAPITASDAEGDAIVLNASSAPAFVSLNDNGNGIGSLQIAPSLNDVGEYTFAVSAADASGNVGAQDIIVTVSQNELTGVVYVNFGLNSTAPSPWNNTNTSPSANTTFSNLKKSDNSNSGIALKLLDRWDGGSNTNGESTGSNSGVYPDAVMSSYYANQNGSKRIEVSGLVTDEEYDFIFFGSRKAVTEDRITKYSIGSSETTLNVTQNTTNTTSIRGAKPDSQGKLVINVSKVAGAWFYIGALEIRSYKKPNVLYTPSLFRAIGVSKTKVELSWTDNSDIETGFEVYRSDSQNGGYGLIQTVGADSENFSDTGLQAGAVYYYKIRSINSEGQSTFTDPFAASTHSYSVFINFSIPDEPAPAPWNNTGDEPFIGNSYSNLKNENNNNTGLTMRVVENSQGTSFTAFGSKGVNTGNNSGIYPDEVTKSYWWTEQIEVATVQFENLDFSKEYDFVFFGSREAANRGTDFTIQNNTVSLDASYNTNNTVSIRRIKPDENGTIKIDAQSTDGAVLGYLGAIVINVSPRTNNVSSARSIADNSKKMTLSAVDQAFDSRLDEGLESDDLSIINVFPNPFTKELKVDLSAHKITNDKPLELAIYNMFGALIYEKDYYNSKMQMVEFSDELPSGMYILHLKSGELNKKLKLLKQ